MNVYIRAYINADKVCPSGYYRITQYFSDESNFGTHPLMPIWVFKFWHSRSSILHKILAPFVLLLIIIRVTASLTLDLYNISRGKKYVIIVQRSTCPKIMPLLTAFLLEHVVRKAERFIWDFDDNIIDSKVVSDREFKILTRYTSDIIVTNEFLLEKLPENCRGKVTILPTTDGDMTCFDRGQVLNKRLSSFHDELRVVWVGTSGGLTFVKHIMPALEETAAQLARCGRKMSLSIVCNQSLNYVTHYLELHNICWSHNIAIETILKSHIGIMPLQSNNFTLGKGGFKLIQYLSASLPVLASNVGYNKTIVQCGVGNLIDDEKDINGWNLTQYDFLVDENTYCNASRNAYLRYCNYFSFENNRKNLLNLTTIK